MEHMDATAEAILDGLDDAQRMAATAVRGPVRIIAGAGAGKTRTVTRRIAYACAIKAWDPHATLAVTFSVKAAAEMRNRLSQLDVASDVKAATFHSAALHQLRRIWPDVCEGPMPFISRNPREIVEHSLRRVTTQQVDDDTVRNLQAEINWCKISLIAPEDYERVCVAIHHQPPAGLEPSQFVDVYKAYETEKTNRNEIDFDDILLITCHLIESDEDVAASIRSGITWLTVDEYQDVSPLQHRLLTRWLGDNRNICVVGDPAQTIYSFAGASSYNLLNFASEFDPSPPTSDSTTTTVPPRRSSTTPTACSKPHRNAPTISNSTPSETKAAESRKPSTTAISKKPGAWLHASADSWTREHLRATAPSSPESTRSRKSSAGHWANNTCATASNETADGRTPRSRMTLRPAWPCWKHLAQAATLKA